MGQGQRAIGDVILGDAPDTEGLSAQNSTVLSCGGIFIPHRGEERRILYHIITTSSLNEPVKVVTGARPRNRLHEVLLKETMN
ncbi:MAG: hypothetical protein V2A66_02835 [Pseudomonadota bacterium]